MRSARLLEGVRVLACFATGLGVGGCVGEPIASTSDAGEGSTTTGTSSTSSSGGPADDTRGTTSSDPTGASSTSGPDGGDVVFECDPFAKDCPAGEKCSFWADDGGRAWNATRCVPVVDDPAGAGEPCHVERSPTSGIDDCDLESMCFYVDPESLEGTCTRFCQGEETDPQCEDPGQFCLIQTDGALVLCLPWCNPLQQDCAPDRACYPMSDEWGCLLDASGDMGSYGDPCELVDGCDPGLACLDAGKVPPGQACEGSIGCCTEICDLSDAAGDQQCAGAAEGQTCQSWYEEGAAPAGYESVGACALPA
jgi:hypothetical protein